MSLRRAPSPELSDAARRRLEALRRDLLRESGVEADPVAHPEPAPSYAPVAVEEPPVVPRPGRHAGHRPREVPAWLTSVVERLPAGLADRPVGAPHVAAVAVLAMVLVAGGAWWALVLRGAAPVPVAPAPTGRPGPGSASAAPMVDLPSTSGAGEPAAGPGVGTSPAGPAEEGAATPEMVIVDVAGRVRRPGLATLPAGARVADALEAAGGARRGVRLLSLNLARVLVDGEQILVGVRPPDGAGLPGLGGVADPAAAPEGPAAAAAGGTAVVDLNSADATQLETLPGVGPVTAAAILDWRAEHGGFTAVEELLEVSGIGPATMEDLRPFVTV